MSAMPSVCQKLHDCDLTSRGAAPGCGCPGNHLCIVRIIKQRECNLPQQYTQVINSKFATSKPMAFVDRAMVYCTSTAQHMTWKASPSCVL